MSLRLLRRRRRRYADDMNPLRRTHLELDGLDIVLAENRPLRLTGARGMALLCTGGCAWITAAGHPDDVFLHTGETWQVGDDGLVLVEAVGQASVRMQARS